MSGPPWVPAPVRVSVPVPVEGGRKVAVSGVGVGRPRTDHLHYTAPSETGGVDERDEGAPASDTDLTEDQLANTPKNAPCPCGSGKKFKMCHGRR